MLAKWFPALVLIVFAGYIASKARMPKSSPSEMQIYEFGKLPLAYEGRVKPYDTLARNSLQILSGRQEVGVLDDKGEVKSHLPAIRWLLDAISGAEGGRRPSRLPHRESRPARYARPGASPAVLALFISTKSTSKKASVPDEPNIARNSIGKSSWPTRRRRRTARCSRTRCWSWHESTISTLILVVSFRSPPLSPNTTDHGNS